MRHTQVLELDSGFAQSLKDRILRVLCLPAATPPQLFSHKVFQLVDLLWLFLSVAFGKLRLAASRVSFVPPRKLISTHTDEECQRPLGCITLRLLLRGPPSSQHMVWHAIKQEGGRRTELQAGSGHAILVAPLQHRAAARKRVYLAALHKLLQLGDRALGAAVAGVERAGWCVRSTGSAVAPVVVAHRRRTAGVELHRRHGGECGWGQWVRRHRRHRRHRGG
mmetsp:Transcript_65364/g.156131  ORF Transcript_65364/g.156131 Transcript_65364/m.156131 type:complete len:222 (+) Transcript_65364:686-1351(+)